MDTVSPPMYRWNTIPWRKLERTVFKLQKRIFQASQRGDVRAIHRLQRLLIHSKAAKYLAVRRVTQDNQGKKTAGVDGVKSLTPEARLKLVNNLKLKPSGKATRRVWIPKPGKNEKRPLGIPTMYDRALQALVKMAMEPEWEAKFEAKSYGFRPGRSAHDAIQAIFSSIKQCPKYVLDADISKCFDRINHSKLLQKTETFPKLKRILSQWLKAGVKDGNNWLTTEEGTPQGGVISPLLANIALHGLETAVRAAIPGSITVNGKRQRNWKPEVVRYADDFVILHRDVQVLKKCQQVAQEWLKQIGLEINWEKTQIVHSLESGKGYQTGFDFLGFEIRQYHTDKHNSARNYQNEPLGFKTIIKPSKKAIQRHYEHLATIVDQHRSTPQYVLIQRLNSVITGWTNYYRTACSGKTFRKLDELIYKKLLAWAIRRHQNIGIREVVNKYWRQIGKAKWTFATTEGLYLGRHSATPKIRHLIVKGSSSPFDGNWQYWTTRLRKHPEINPKVAKLLKLQKGVCVHCGLLFKSGDLIEVHHQDGCTSNNHVNNLMALHRHCHDQIHGQKVYK